MKPAAALRRAAFALAILATGAMAAASAHAESLIRVRMNADIRSTEPGVNRDENTDAVVLHVVEGLVAFRGDTSVAPMLASAVDMSTDGLVYTFTLRDGVKFHNGAPLTADDVVWSWTRYLAPKTGWRCLSEFDGRGIAKIVKVEAPDARTVRFTLDKPSALFLVDMARTDCGGSGIYHRSSVDADGKWIAPVGTGPFKMGEWRKGQFVELTKFDAYAALPGPRDGLVGDKTPLVEKVRFIIIPDSSAAKAALIRGDVDLVYEVADAERPDYLASPGITVDANPSMDVLAILLQTKDPILSDVRVRRALALAIDARQLVDAVKTGLAQPDRSPIPRPSSYFSAVQAEIPAPDIEKARQLLREAGYRGQPIKLVTNKSYSAMYDAAVIVQAMAQQAGLNVELDVMDWATELDRYSKGNYQAMSFGYSARLDPSLSFDMFMGPKATQPRKVWDDPQAQTLLDDSMRVADHAQRQKFFDALDEKLQDQVPAVFLFSNVVTNAVRKNVTGFKGWAVLLPRLWGVSVK